MPRLIIALITIIISIHLFYTPIIAQTSCSQPYQNNDYYISPTGNDTNSGLSQNQPWATFNHAWQFICPGDTLWLMDGTYYQQIRPNVRDGAPNPAIDITDYHSYPLDHPERTKYYIKIRALNDGQAIIDGQYHPPPPEPTPATPVPTPDPSQIPVFIGGRCPFYTCSPHPNNGDYFLLEGIVAKNSSYSVYFIQGKNVVIRRCSGYDGNTDNNSYVFHITNEWVDRPDTPSDPANILMEDNVAGGSGRKMMVAVWRAVNVVFRRQFAAWMEWRNHDSYDDPGNYTGGHWPWGDTIENYVGNPPLDQKDLTGYTNLLGNSIFENSIIYGMFSNYGFSLSPNPYGITRHNQFLGLITVKGGHKWDSNLMTWPCPNPYKTRERCSNFTSWAPLRAGFNLGHYSTPTFINNQFSDLFAWGNASYGIAAGPWASGSDYNYLSHITLTNNSLDPNVWWHGAEISSDDLNRFIPSHLYIEGDPQHSDKSKGARLRYRYVNGELMDGSNGRPAQELWPWPMEDRIRQEFTTHMAHYHSVNPELQDFSVTNTIVPLINAHTAVPVPPSVISGTPAPSSTPIATDIDGDSDTDWLDLSILINAFDQILDLTDFNTNNIIDIFDFNLVLKNL